MTGAKALTAAVRLCVAAMCLAVSTVAMAQPGIDYLQPEIVNVRGSLYLARFDERATMFLVTPDGIVMTDPLSADIAKWLSGEFERRFPGVPVRYVLLSHSHFDRAAGASVFNGAETIGHRWFNVELRSSRSSAAYANVTPVSRSYDTRQRITIGGRNVEIVYAGPAHSADLSVIYFPDERVAFAVDTLNVDRVPYSFGPYSPVEVAEWLDAVAPLDVDLLVDGEGKTMAPAAVKQLRPYMRDLVDSVRQGVIAGRSLGQLRSAIQLPAHRDNPNYAARVQHIEQVYRSLSVHRWSTWVTGGASLLSTTSYCAGYSNCNPLGGVLTGGTAGLDYSVGRYGFGVEFSGGPQLVVSRLSPLYDDSVANRRTTTAVFGRYRIGSGPLLADLIAGGTTVTSDTKGLNLVKEAEIPYGGRHAIASNKTFTGFIVGADVILPISSRWTVRVPVRFSSVETGNDELHPGSRDVQFGLGFGYRLAYAVYHSPGKDRPIVVRSRPLPPASGQP
jgi:glyoxylase-like metal-dependent hydrolase (beta-lactamase superfamily II)